MADASHANVRLGSKATFEDVRMTSASLSAGEGKPMPFYTAEANGMPFVVFKAADKDSAVSLLNSPMVVTELSTRNDPDGKLIWAGVTPLHVRPATGQEYAKWLAAKQTASALVFLIDNTTSAPIRPGLTHYT